MIFLFHPLCYPIAHQEHPPSLADATRKLTNLSKCPPINSALLIFIPV